MTDLPVPLDPAALAQDFAAQIEAGASFRDACRTLGVPRTTAQRLRMLNWHGFGDCVRAAEARRDRAPNGRPALYDAELAEAVCAGLAAGRALVEVCAEPDMPAMTTVMRWRRDHPEFREAYDIARQVQAEVLDDESLAIARAASPGTVNVDRLLIGTMDKRSARLRARHAPDRREPAAPRPIRIEIVRAEEGAEPLLTARVVTLALPDSD